MNKTTIFLSATTIIFAGLFADLYMRVGMDAKETTVAAVSDTSPTSEQSGMLVAIIDEKKIMIEGDVYVSLKKDYEQKLAEVKVEADSEKEKLKKENDRVTALRSTATPEAFKKEVEKFAKAQQKSSELIGGKLKDLEAAYITAINKIKVEKIDKILEELASEQNLSLITSKSVSLFYKPSLDITETVLFRLNKEIDKAKLEM